MTVMTPFSIKVNRRTACILIATMTLGLALACVTRVPRNGSAQEHAHVDDAQVPTPPALVANASPAVEGGAEAAAALPDEIYAAYRARIDEAAGVRSRDSVADVHRDLENVDRQTAEDVRRMQLSLKRKGRCSEQDYKGLETRWKDWQQLAVFLDETAQWTDGILSIWGTMRYDMIAAWVTELSVEFRYLLHNLDEDSPKLWLQHVYAARPASAIAQRTRAKLVEDADRWLPRAPEASQATESGITACVQSRIDQRRIKLSVAVFERLSSQIAESICSLWSGLQAEMGGQVPCRKTITEYLLSAGAGFEPEERNSDPSSFSNMPPGRDAAYAAFADPIHEACVFAPVLKTRKDVEAAACLANAKEAALRALAAVQPEGSSFVRELEIFLSQLRKLDDFADPGFNYTCAHCQWLYHLRIAFLADAWSRDDAPSFAKHVQFRAPWSAKVRDGLRMLEVAAKLPLCQDEWNGWSDGCRLRRQGNEARWKPMLKRANAAPDEATRVGVALCGRWKRLGALLGETCASQVANYALSYSHELGELASAAAEAK